MLGYFNDNFSIIQANKGNKDLLSQCYTLR